MFDDGISYYVLSSVYASPKAQIRDTLWYFLKAAKSFIRAPWCLVGDWNQVYVAGIRVVVQRSVPAFSTNAVLFLTVVNCMNRVSQVLNTPGLINVVGLA